MSREFNAALGQNEDQLRAAWPQYQAELDEMQGPFAGTEEELILELDAALEQYQEQLAARVRRLEATNDPESPDTGGSSGSDLLLAVVAL